jgi:predicted Zn-dependent protease
VKRAALAAAALAAGCAARPALLGARLPAECARAERPGAVDRCAGWVLDRLLLASSLRAYDDRALTRYVAAVGRRVAARAGRADLRWTFRGIDDPEPQGWSLIGGFVYVTRGALARLGSEAELAALLAHEIAHVAADHGDDLFAGRDAGELADAGALRRRRAHQRDDEAQADERSAALVAAAGYDPRAALAMLRALHEGSDPGDGDRLDREHAATAARLARIERVLAGRTGGVRGVARYRARLDGLVIGADRRTGRVVGDTAGLAAADLAVPFAPPWQADDEAELLFARPDGAVARVQFVPAGWLEVFRTAISWQPGRAAAVELGRTSEPAAAVALWRGRAGAAALLVTAPTDARADAALAELLAGARAPSPAERAAAAPRRLRSAPAHERQHRSGRAAAAQGAAARLEVQ